MIDDTNSINILNHTIMSTKSFLHEVMSLAWQFVRKNGFTMSEALKCAWANMKLKLQMKSRKRCALLNIWAKACAAFICFRSLKPTQKTTIRPQASLWWRNRNFSSTQNSRNCPVIFFSVWPAKIR